LWDIVLNVSLVLTAITFVFVGVHASVSPVALDDSQLPLFRRHSTHIWIWLAAIALVNIALVIVQARRQEASTLTVEQFQKGISDVKTMLSRLAGVDGLSKPQATASIGPVTASVRAKISPAIDSNSQLSQVARRANVDTLSQLKTVNQSARPEILPLTNDQLELVAISASDLATTMQRDFDSGVKAWQDDNDKQEQAQEDEFVRRGDSRDQARQKVNSMHTGGTASSWSVDHRRIAMGVANSNALRIQSIINVLKSDPTKFQGDLANRASALSNVCVVPGNTIKDCTDALNALATAIQSH
jgi:hypothetical protein